MIARNKRARFDFELQDQFEAGIVLHGTEVKSLRLGQASLNESYAAAEGGEIFLINAHIPPYLPAAHGNHEEKRKRKLLLKRREINRLIGAAQRQRATLVPVEMYFNAKGRAKLQLALGFGKRKHDKRETIKQRDWQRSRDRARRGGERDNE